MQPITRKEMYLNRLAGQQAQAIPAEPITREEQYLGRLCGENNVIPEEPRTRKEIYLANLCGEDVTPPAEAITRIEQYMAFASGERETKPANPLTREEWYWDKYQGGDVPEEKTIAFTDIITVTDALARPAVDLQSEITATQNLNGYDYPWVGGAGKNKFNKTRIANAMSGAQYITLDLAPNTEYTMSSDDPCKNNGDTVDLFFCRMDEEISSPTNGVKLGKTVTRTSDANGHLRVGYRCFENWITPTQLMAYNTQIELGSTATTYAPYENICPISGRTEVNVTRTGKNLLDWETVWADYLSDGVLVNPLATVRYMIPSVFIGKQITFSAKIKANTTAANCRVVCNVNGTRTNGNLVSNPTDFETSSVTFTPQSTSDYIYTESSGPNGTYKELQLEISSTATEYEPYEGDTFNTELGRTVYGGTLDLTTGELTITHAYVDLGDLTWTLLNTNLFRTTLYSKKDGTTNFTTTCYRTVNKTFTELQNGETASITLSEHGHPLRLIHVKDERATTAEEFTTLVTGQKMVYELATPQTISLTPTEVMMLENNNTIWADAGRVQLTYLSKAAQRVQTMNASLKANTLNITKAITGGVKA